MTALKVSAAIALVVVLGYFAYMEPGAARVGRPRWTSGEQDRTVMRQVERLSFEAVGCCLDDVVRADWDPDGIRLHFSRPGRQPLRIPVSSSDHVIDHSLVAFGMLGGENWAIDAASVRSLVPRIPAAAAVSMPALPGMGSAQAVTVTGFRNGMKGIAYRLLISMRPRVRTPSYALTSSGGENAAAKPAFPQNLLVYPRSPSPDALMEYRTDTGSIHPLLAGLDLYAPTGLALTDSGDRLYVADERPTELVWHELEQKPEDFCADKWSYRGAVAHFPLTGPERGLFRGLWTRGSIVFGSAPGGLYFFTNDGQNLGRIETSEPVTYLLPAHDRGSDYLYAAVGQRLCRLRLNSTNGSPAVDMRECNPVQAKKSTETGRPR